MPHPRRFFLGFVACLLVALWAGPLSAAIPQVVAGAGHALALKQDGGLLAWGDDGKGQLGLDRQLSVVTPQQILSIKLGLQPPQGALAAGSFHVLARLPDGSLWSWGNNANGQLGDGSIGSRSKPAAIQGIDNVTTMACGGYHSLAVMANGTVWSWGNNNHGQLGDDTTTQQFHPIQVMYTSDVIAVAAGYQHSLALKSDGTVWAWGLNDHGQLGQGSADNDSHTVPRQLTGLAHVKGIVTRRNHNLALMANGTVWAWGDNHNGQLGDGTTTDQYNPVQISGLSDIVAVANGSYHSLAVKANGTVWSWGNNQYGQLGDGTSSNQKNSPAQVIGLIDVVAVAAGWGHSLALKKDGTVWAWGMNDMGQLGQGSADESAHTAPVRVPTINDVTTLTSAGDSGLVADKNGMLWGWGDNSNGQIGGTQQLSRSVPNSVLGLTDLTIRYRKTGNR